MFRAPLCPSSRAQEYYTVVAACGISCCGFQVAGLVRRWGLCVRFARCWFTVYLCCIYLAFYFHILRCNIFNIFIYLAGCTMFSHLPAPIWQLYFLFPPVTSVIPVFFHQSLLSHQSFNPFRPGEFRSTLFSSSRWMPFHNFFWQSSIGRLLWSRMGKCSTDMAGTAEIKYPWADQNYHCCLAVWYCLSRARGRKPWSKISWSSRLGFDAAGQSPLHQKRKLLKSLLEKIWMDITLIYMQINVGRTEKYDEYIQYEPAVIHLKTVYMQCLPSSNTMNR